MGSGLTKGRPQAKARGAANRQPTRHRSHGAPGDGDGGSRAAPRSRLPGAGRPRRRRRGTSETLTRAPDASTVPSRNLTTPPALDAGEFVNVSRRWARRRPPRPRRAVVSSQAALEGGGTARDGPRRPVGRLGARPACPRRSVPPLLCSPLDQPRFAIRDRP